MSLSSIRSWFAKGNRAQWGVFVLLFLSIFLKCICFHWYCFNSILVSSIVNHPLSAVVFYSPKIIVSLLIACFVFVSKKQWWTILVLILIDIWILANLVYYRANGLFIDINAILMASNLEGFESSIGTYFLIKYWLFPLMTIIYSIMISVLDNTKQRLWKHFVWGLVIVITSNFAFCFSDWIWALRNMKGLYFDMNNGRELIYQIYGRTGLRVFEPFHDVKLFALPEFTKEYDYAKGYIRDNSIIHYFGAMIVYYTYSEKKIEGTITKEIEAQILNIKDKVQTTHPQDNLIMILVESFESWSLTIPSTIALHTPAKYFNEIKNYPHTIYFNNIRSQAKHGVSGDGQMTLCSGLLPINAGAACMLYGDNVYPNIASNYEHSIFIDIEKGCWNQRVMTLKYGFKYDCYATDSIWDDKVVFEHLNNVLDTIEEPFCILLLTGAMHSPFDRFNINNLDLPHEMPNYMNDYLECLFLTDSCFGIFWKNFKQSEIRQKTNIVITGDHTVFKEPMLRDFHTYANGKGWEIPQQESFTPLIIYSPFIEGNIQVTDTCYQMDIYPTIMHLIGCEDYYWKGFGVNLLDSTARHNRPITEQEAYRLSDLMIRSDYFNRYLDLTNHQQKTIYTGKK